jgi:hypothetical protein
MTLIHSGTSMKPVSLFRLYVLRGMYLFIAVGLGTFMWPDFIAPERHWETGQGMSLAMLCAFSLMCALGLRYPLQMIPMLLWEVGWKTLWLLRVPLPQWMAGHVDPALGPSIFACCMVLIVYIAIPWGYVFSCFISAPGDRWR